mmetsp:Transcript_82353/g.259876  ORF Transcript_82353/g.259876 Transcript_82353/m.259876 type:complete len:244 (+) Transcript_82353:956-1687(+)
MHLLEAPQGLQHPEAWCQAHNGQRNLCSCVNSYLPGRWRGVQTHSQAESKRYGSQQVHDVVGALQEHQEARADAEAHQGLHHEDRVKTQLRDARSQALQRTRLHGLQERNHHCGKDERHPQGGVVARSSAGIGFLQKLPDGLGFTASGRSQVPARPAVRGGSLQCRGDVCNRLRLALGINLRADVVHGCLDPRPNSEAFLELRVHSRSGSFVGQSLQQSLLVGGALRTFGTVAWLRRAICAPP